MVSWFEPHSPFCEFAMVISITVRVQKQTLNCVVIVSGTIADILVALAAEGSSALRFNIEEDATKKLSPLCQIAR